MPSARRLLNKVLKPTGREIVRSKDLVDFYLHDYRDYEHYRQTQEFHNIRKINDVWADEETLTLMCDELRSAFGDDRLIRGLCHGSRNGFEQKFISSLTGFDAIGTDISKTAADFDRTVQWDFHDVNPEWVGAFDFVYSNSHDQGWNPRAALAAWLNQTRDGGFVVLEHTENHGPRNASEMDPFGVRPIVLPYVLTMWFGMDISMRFVKARKPNKNIDVWLFFLKRNVASIE